MIRSKVPPGSSPGCPEVSSLRLPPPPTNGKVEADATGAKQGAGAWEAGGAENILQVRITSHGQGHSTPSQSNIRRPHLCSVVWLPSHPLQLCHLWGEGGGKSGTKRPHLVGVGFAAAGAAQTPEIGDARPAQNIARKILSFRRLPGRFFPFGCRRKISPRWVGLHFRGATRGSTFGGVFVLL